ncbi:hypothetical protein GSI_12335 [Ganoderma sinense ZZ0214-1]|uniref:F-box domain-containing protein n=1 Tax=Ganoderma sinense ZZ0214-1 TaxID=1077348 RepID=A0A2G8RYL6_9APHY|nr:hypothetical protein GSI_12335 [Ganoderma sinense ZZ0214-1]
MTASESSPLHSLGIYSTALRRRNMQCLSTLVDLALALVTGSDPLGPVFTHCSQLRFLTLLVGEEYTGDVAATLRAHSDALPLLTAFRLSDPYMDKASAEGVASFLRKKALLERLEMSHHWESTCSSENIAPVLDILPDLPRLRILGWELSGHSRTDPNLTPDNLLNLSARIPRQLTALSLWVTARSPTTVTEEDWIQFFRDLRACRFIHILTHHGFLGTRTLQAALLDHPPPVSELVGFNEDIAWVERDRETGGVGYSEPWSLSKVYNRTVEEFGCEEWEWLLRPIDMRLMDPHL